MKTRHKLMIAKTAYWSLRSMRSLVGLGDDVVVTRRNIRWRLDLREGIDLAIYLQGWFEPEIVTAYHQFVKQGQIALDIGANIGAHTLGLAQAVGETGRVIAFEPTRFAYEKLLTNVSLNPTLARRITAEQIMLGGTEEMGLPQAIYSSWPVAGSANQHAKHLGALKSTAGARLLPLDRYLEASGIERVDFIKMDVDGFECDVLAGATGTLARYRPVMICEIAPYVLVERGASLKQMMDYFLPLGYRFYSLRGSHLLPEPAKAMSAMIADGAGINVVVRVE